MIHLRAYPLQHIKSPRAFPGISTWHVFCLLLLTWIPTACTHFQPETVPADKAAEQLVADLAQTNTAVKQFTCMARITLSGPGRRAHAFRAAIAGQLPNRLRIDMLTPFGVPAANFSSDGRHLYLVNHTSRDYHKTRLGSGSLRRLIHVDISVNELVELLLGRIPMETKWRVRLVASKTQASPRLAFYDIWGVERQQIGLDSADRPVEATWYDRRHRPIQRLVVDGRQVIDGFALPEHLELTTESGDRVMIRLERYVPNAQLKDSLFILEPLPS